MNRFEVQYIIGFDSNVPYCKSQDSYKNLLTTIDKLDIKGTTQLYYDGVSIFYKIKSHSKTPNKMKYYNVSFSINHEANLDIFVRFLSNHRKVVSKLSTIELENTWNDISLYYSMKSYPLINEIENLMRRLITTFMLINVGQEWIKLNVPTDVKESVKSETKGIRSNFLYETDFIKLSEFLFKKYSEYDVTDLFELITSTQHTLEVETLGKYVPKSNWERFFTKIVECDDIYIIKRWEKLYKLRCKVAHNKPVIKQDYLEIKKLTNEIRPKLDKAIKNIDKITVTQEDLEDLTNTFNKTKNDYLYSFINFRSENEYLKKIRNRFVHLSIKDVYELEKEFPELAEYDDASKHLLLEYLNILMKTETNIDVNYDIKDDD